MKKESFEYEIENHLFADKSPVAGTGLFTSKDIKEGEVAFVMKGPKIKYHPKNKEEAMAIQNCVGIGKDLYIYPSSPYVFINHHCEPNLIADENNPAAYVAIRDIKAGEELTFDYSTSEYSEWEMECSCSSPKCRKVIKSIDKLPADYFTKYFPNIPKYFQKIFFKKYIKNHK